MTPTPRVEITALERPPMYERVLNLVVVVTPLAGLAIAIVLLWHRSMSWVFLAMLGAGYIATTLGITVGFHRLFTHRSFKTSAWVKVVFGALGSMAVQGPALRWAATHRLHHQHSDHAEDPHSPNAHGAGLASMLRGIYHAHIGWFFTPAPVGMERFVPDLIADPAVRWVDRLFVLWVALGLLLPAGVGLACTGTWAGAWLGLLWGGLVRILLVQHVTWSVNSVCHLWGSRPFRSHDLSRNNAVLGWLALGEGWHNAHHAFPTSARHGLRWWELDLTFLLIRGMAAIGLAREIRVPSPERIASKVRSSPPSSPFPPSLSPSSSPSGDFSASRPALEEDLPVS